MIPVRRFCLIRHGQTDANRDGRIAGVLEAQLTDTGRAAARALSTLDWPVNLHLFVSPQARARETVRLAFPARAATVVPDLRERHWGRFEGRPVTELPPRDSTPPGGEGWADFLSRVGAALTFCLLRADAGLPVIIAHSGVIRAARALTGGDPLGPSAPNTAPLLFTPSACGWHESPPAGQT